MNSDLLSIKLKFKSIVKDVISAYGLNQEGKWTYVPSNDNSYYDLIVNNRLGAFKYKLKNSESKLILYITNKYEIIVEDGISFFSGLPKSIGTLTENEFITLKTFILQSTSKTDIEEILNNESIEELHSIYGNKCTSEYIEELIKVETQLKNQNTDIKEFDYLIDVYYHLYNPNAEELNQCIKLQFRDDFLECIEDSTYVLFTTYINVSFVAKTPKRIVMSFEDLITKTTHTVTVDINSYADKLIEQLKELYSIKGED